MLAKNIKKEGIKNFFVDDNSLFGKYLAKDIYDSNSGIIHFEAGDEITENMISFLNEKNINTIDILNINSDKQGTYIRDTFFCR